MGLDFIEALVFFCYAEGIVAADFWLVESLDLLVKNIQNYGGESIP